MMIRSRLSVAAGAALLLSACYGAGGTASMAGGIGMADSALGTVLVDSAGMTLYTFDNDTLGKSNCNGQCAANWPPLMAEAGATPSGDFSVIVRDDGSRQWAVRGMPLYGWVQDEKPGDTTGEGFRDVWHVARP